MIKGFLFLFLVSLAYLCGIAQTNIIVLNDGSVIEGYNIDLGNGEKCYYSTDKDGENIKGIKKSDILIIKLTDGTKIDPLNYLPQQENIKNIITSDLTYKSMSNLSTDKKGNKTFLAKNGEQILNMRILPGNKKEIAITRPPKGMKYDLLEYQLPAYVVYEGELYVVTQVDDSAFEVNGFILRSSIENIIFSSTITEIGNSSFSGLVSLKKIILPGNIKKIGNYAFSYSGATQDYFTEIYLPETIEFIGKDAFRNVGNSKSPRGFTKARFTSLPLYINEDNCLNFGIDDEAVKRYLESTEYLPSN